MPEITVYGRPGCGQCLATSPRQTTDTEGSPSA